MNISAGLKESEQNFLYRIIRRYKPSIVIETGSGASTACILQGLKKNKSGQLYSVDMPDLEGQRRQGDRPIKMLWSDLQKEYHNWIVYEENIVTFLPKLVQQVSKIDLFLHDSKHTSDHIRFEFVTVLSKIGIGGIFGMHDMHSKEVSEFMKFMSQHNSFEFIGKKRQLGFWKRVK